MLVLILDEHVDPDIALALWRYGIDVTTTVEAGLRTETDKAQLEQLIARDVALCEAMTDEMEDYIKSNALFWEPNRTRPGGMGLPKLTFGGLLLAMRRLETLHNQLDLAQAGALTLVQDELALQKVQWSPRYKPKLTRDLRSQLDAWAWYLDDCQSQGERAIVFYPRQVETRVKIDLLLDEADGIELDVKQSSERRAALDGRLSRLFAVGAFCWLEELGAGFPRDRFWYLYGLPRND